MKVLNIKIEGKKIDFCTEQNVYRKDSQTSNLGVVNTNNLIAFVGKNASGKTALIKQLRFVFEMLQGKELKNFEGLKGFDEEENTLEVEAIFKVADTYYKLHSNIVNVDGRYVFEREELFEQKRSKVRNRIVRFTQPPLMVRDSVSDYPFLKDNVSIASKFSHPNIVYVENEISWGEKIRSCYNLPCDMTVIDSQIETLKVEKASDLVYIGYKGGRKACCRAEDIANCLSSGTIQYLYLMSNIQRVLSTGGYLLVDDIDYYMDEDALGRILSMFSSQNNPKGAVLLFTTRSLEMLDSVSRNDSIYILTNSEEIGVELSRLNHFYTRNDKKRSKAVREFIKKGIMAYDKRQKKDKKTQASRCV